MKQIILLSLLSFFLLSCNKDILLHEITQANDLNECALTKTVDNDEIIASNIIKDGYLKFVNYAYMISISLEEAGELGYTKSAYLLLEDHLKTMNEMIMQKINQLEKDSSNVKYSIVDCTYETDLNESSLNVERNQMPRGILDATLGTPVTMTVWAPNEMRSVKGHCYSNVALLGGHIVETHFGGGNLFKTRMGNGYLSIGISASHTSGTIKYTTTDSYGGKFSWEGSTEYAS